MCIRDRLLGSTVCPDLFVECIFPCISTRNHRYNNFATVLFKKRVQKKPAEKFCRLPRLVYLDRSGYFVGTQASGTNAHCFRCSVYQCLHFSDIRFPSPVAPSMGVADFNSERNALPANFTFRHLSAPPISILCNFQTAKIITVSYTHLDVYKRQVLIFVLPPPV